MHFGTTGTNYQTRYKNAPLADQNYSPLVHIRWKFMGESGLVVGVYGGWILVAQATFISYATSPSPKRPLCLFIFMPAKELA